MHRALYYQARCIVILYEAELIAAQTEQNLSCLPLCLSAMVICLAYTVLSIPFTNIIRIYYAIMIVYLCITFVNTFRKNFDRLW